MARRRSVVIAAPLVIVAVMPALASYGDRPDDRRGGEGAGISAQALAPSTAPPCLPPPPDGEKLSFGQEPMIAVCRDAFVDPAVPDRDAVARDYAEARFRVAAAFGGLRGPRPLAIFCGSAACRDHFAGTSRRSMTLPAGATGPGARFEATRRTIIVVDGPSVRQDALTHEMVHAEVAERVRPSLVPAWFHEGLATRISGSPDCSVATPSGVEDLTSLGTNRAWVEHTSRPELLRPTYCQARAEVEAWERRHGRPRVATLLDAVRHGQDFGEVYGDVR